MGTGNDSLFIAGGANNNAVGGIGNDWLGSNGDRHHLSGGDGNDWIGATGTFGELEGGSGDDSLLGVGNYHRLFSGDGNDWVGVSGGGSFLVGDAGNDYLAATGNFNHFNGGTGNDQIVAAAGHVNHRYIFAPGSGQDSITGFEGANSDVAVLYGFGLASFAALQPYISQAGADTVITLNGADILTLKNINSGTLAANDFQLV